MPTTLLGIDGNPFTYRDVDASPSGIIFAQGQIKFTGAYTTAIGGDIVDFTTLGDWIPSSQVLSVAFWSTTGNLLFQYTPNGNTATALAAWRVKISASATFGTELGTGAYPATITGDTVIWQATFRKLL